jgi:hypothetical protein
METLRVGERFPELQGRAVDGGKVGRLTGSDALTMVKDLRK